MFVVLCRPRLAKWSLSSQRWYLFRFVFVLIAFVVRADFSSWLNAHF